VRHLCVRVVPLRACASILRRLLRSFKCPPDLLHTLQDRRFVLETLVNGLQRMEYRGYDSAGLEIEGDNPDEPLIFKEVGKVRMLKEKAMSADIDMDKSYVSQTSIAHTRCAVSSREVCRAVALTCSPSIRLQLGHPRCPFGCALLRTSSCETRQP